MSYRAHCRGANSSEDSERLPKGMVRCGYDADTQRHYFRDTATGSAWESRSYYGQMTRVTGDSAPSAGDYLARQHRAAAQQERRVLEETGGVVAVLGVRGVMKSLWDSQLGREVDGGGVYSANVSASERGVSTMRRPRRFGDLPRLMPTEGSSASSRDSEDSVDGVEGKDSRLAMTAAGQKRTILDAT